MKKYLTVAALQTTLCLHAETNTLERGVTYTSEAQSDFGKRAAWMNQIRLDGAWNINCKHSIKAATLHTWRTGSDPVMEEKQVFSNIDNGNMALGVALLGWQFTCTLSESLSLTTFAGVHNMNEEYFVSPLAAAFCNSSDGIHPTLASNFELANYPLSTLGIHAELNFTSGFSIQNSLYNGVAGETTDGTAFRFRPHRDGLVNVTGITYAATGNLPLDYTIGHLVHTQRGSVVWASAEQAFASSSKYAYSVAAQTSYDFGRNSECREYYAGGLLAQGKENCPIQHFGLMYHNAQFTTGNEQSVEATAAISLCPHFTLQPSFQYITTPDTDHMVGLLRAIVEF